MIKTIKKFNKFCQDNSGIIAILALIFTALSYLDLRPSIPAFKISTIDISAIIIGVLTFLAYLTYSRSIPLVPLIIFILLYPSLYRLLKDFLYNKFGKYRKYKIQDWVAIEKPENPQGTDPKKLDLRDGILSELKLKMNPISEYWRFGIKIMDTNSDLYPLGLGGKTALFHLGKNIGNDEISYMAYEDGEIKKSPSSLSEIKGNQEIELMLKINEKNFLTFSINGDVLYSSKVDSSKRARVYMLGWGDGNKYKIEVKDIEYRILK